MDKMGNSMIATVLTSTPVPVPTATLRASTGWSVRTLAICSFARDFAALEEAAICAVALDAIVVLLADEWHDKRHSYTDGAQGSHRCHGAGYREGQRRVDDYQGRDGLHAPVRPHEGQVGLREEPTLPTEDGLLVEGAQTHPRGLGRVAQRDEDRQTQQYRASRVPAGRREANDVHNVDAYVEDDGPSGAERREEVRDLQLWVRLLKPLHLTAATRWLKC
mmetsp:Transcript_81559/g.243156  ORF Transcript_81559/g.243156 Transcript_81559/m.243156 type:complete len:220 (+) Transcript_81559:34-693(+)